MKYAEVLRMAAALLTPSDSTAASGTADAALAVVAAAEKVSLDDPRTVERLRIMVETAVRAFYSKGMLSGEKLPPPVFPVAGEEDFPLPDALAPVVAFYAAWLFTGEERLKLAWQNGLETYLASLEAVIAPIVERH